MTLFFKEKTYCIPTLTNKQRAQLFPRTGISIPDFQALNALFPSTQLLRPIRVTSEGSIEEGTRLLNSFGLKFWYILRIMLNFLVFGWQGWIAWKVKNQETGRWRMNMKWGMILGSAVWTLGEWACLSLMVQESIFPFF